ncbi:MAG: 16S rRNA (cytosine(1402)-N(4))-methyltransferase RsmH [Balneolaceae bacterium]|nr:16S rRNA (cytosine(1402)-N(4))-methyltransferase RsmH [Balneolaceae bacterium]MBO6545002.1 16S rRNA (cytosine(1402)-N(4))-methyltransferase RsmH [Balneolaceae bacterium]MBO6646398.1 16S rRNA (cytosine(1402)-N(4))-methyltransferase RsmH [Balneolaceae bacterium]
MTTYYEHIPVMLQECMNGLAIEKDGIYVDGTLGGGGHSKEIISHLNENGQLYAIDQDDEAIAAASTRIGDDPRFNILKGNFGYLTTLLPPQVQGQVAGILLDLGVSTHQIKEAGRGFSFQEDGPLDMRMGNLTGVSAYQVVNNYEYEQLRDVIFHYGEERASRQIAKAIINARPIETTGELKAAVGEVIKGKFQVKSLARVFQGIRIEVNRELEMLKDVLTQSLEVLKPGGRLVVMSYHSLEDRIVKRFFKAGNLEGKIEKDFYGNVISPLQPINRQVITPSEDEVSKNPAARSAKLRVAEKTNGGGS